MQKNLTLEEVVDTAEQVKLLAMQDIMHEAVKAIIGLTQMEMPDTTVDSFAAMISGSVLKTSLLLAIYTQQHIVAATKSEEIEAFASTETQLKTMLQDFTNRMDKSKEFAMQMHK